MKRSPFLVLLARVGTLLAIYSLLRVLFVLLNRGAFPSVPASAFLGGVRFDLSAIAWLNLPWVLLFLVDPNPGRRFALVQKAVFHAVNGAGFFLNCVDLEYYRFTLKRSTADLLRIASAGNDTANLAPAFVRDFWWVLLVLIACIALAEVGYRWAARFAPPQLPTLLRRVLWRIAACAVVVLGSRGGVQLIPLGVLHAGNYAAPAYFPVVLNTPFTLLMSLGKPVIEEHRYMAQEEADALWPVAHQYTPRDSTSQVFAPGTRPNVAIIILESFSAAYSERLSGQPGYMPFLDSLMGTSLSFTRAYANGRRSIDGIPAVLAGIPELMDEAFLASPYAQTPFTSVANLLAAEGYATSFYHGGRNGTMGFDVFARSAGFQRYVGLDEYPDPADHDGHWGIRDRPFLRFWADGLDREHEPFVSALFTLSSHHPYELTDEDARRFPPEKLPILRTLRYSDDALRQFFALARTKPWFDRTLFVITADHTADIERNGQHYSQATDYWVPLLVHAPGRIVPRAENRVTQQIDILPTVLDLIGYDRLFFCFGSSAVRAERAACSVGASTGSYLIIDSTGTLVLTREQLAAAPTASSPLPIRTLQAAVQQFNGHLLHRDLVIARP